MPITTNLDFTIPIWGIIITLLVPFVVWIVVTMFNHKGRIKALETSRTETKEALSSMKMAIDQNKNAIDTRLKEMEVTMIETKTMVKLLVDNRIKKPGE